ncbi:MAG: hypothetical protein CME06_10960 [Gemmatimonadetes bacterium]|nr:hypothetical protein [Gemmatimonadota bacterium]
MFAIDVDPARFVELERLAIRQKEPRSVGRGLATTLSTHQWHDFEIWRVTDPERGGVIEGWPHQTWSSLRQEDEEEEVGDRALVRRSPPFVARPAQWLRFPERNALFAAGSLRFRTRPTSHQSRPGSRSGMDRVPATPP